MATVHTPPIDLYAESVEGFGEDRTEAPTTNEGRRPDVNGDRDEQACETSNRALDQVLGW
jgi:hypothetical protein